MAKAQLDAWIGVHRGSIDAVASVVDASLADAALARMMLCRRRAVVAQVVSDFFVRMGSRFHPYLEGRIPRPPVNSVDELAMAKAAGDIVGDVYGAPPPLLFERALLAEAGGRLEDARADFEQLLASYPGFVTAAIAAARVASKVGDPTRAIRSLAAVAGEVTHIREGATLLADAARAVGLHETASRYDLAALICQGAYDSRGNDCAPVDVTGKIANDNRMPQIFYFESQADGSLVCNARGIYYRVNPMLRWALLLFSRGRPVSAYRRLGGGSANSRAGMMLQASEATAAKLRLFLDRPTSFARTLRWLAALSADAWWQLRRIGVAIFGTIGNYLHRIDAALFRVLTGFSAAVTIFLYRAYQILPPPVRAPAGRRVGILLARLRSLALSWARRLSPYAGRGLVEISERNAGLRIARSRYRSGLARILGLRTPAKEEASRLSVMRQQLSNLDGGEASPNLRGRQMLSPLAAEVLNRLVSEIDAGGEDSPRT